MHLYNLDLVDGNWILRIHEKVIIFTYNLFFCWWNIVKLDMNNIEVLYDYYVL